MLPFCLQPPAPSTATHPLQGWHAGRDGTRPPPSWCVAAPARAGGLLLWAWKSPFQSLRHRGRRHKHPLDLCGARATCLSCQGHPVPASTARQRVWNPGRVRPLEQLLLNTVLGLLSFYTHFRISLFLQKQAPGALTGTAWSLRITLGNTAILRTRSLPIREREVSSQAHARFHWTLRSRRRI